MKSYTKPHQVLLAKWAADCAERVLPMFESSYSQDRRPRNAIKACRAWIRTGEFHMTIIRGASLSSHAAARKAKANQAACFAARAAGQAVATAHVPQHAFGASYYGLKAVMASDPGHAEEHLVKEWKWQYRHMPKQLKKEFVKRMILQKKKNRVRVVLHKGSDF